MYRRAVYNDEDNAWIVQALLILSTSNVRYLIPIKWISYRYYIPGTAYLQRDKINKLSKYAQLNMCNVLQISCKNRLWE